jgi:hypothetical protein
MTSKGAWWPVAIIGVLAVTVGANGYLLYRAGQSDAPMEHDYYLKAVAWDSTMAQAKRNSGLGWRVAATLQPDGRLTARITDQAGEAIHGAAVRVEGFAIARADGDVAATLAPEADQYQGTVTVRHPGLHELRFSVERATERFTATLRGVPGQPFAPKP